MYNLQRAKPSEREEEMKIKYLRREEILEGQEEQKASIYDGRNWDKMPSSQKEC